MKNGYLIILCFLLPLGLRAQQYPLFTNYWTHTYGFNPASITRYEGVLLNAQYRHQWLGLDDAPVTKLAAGHARLGRWGLGTYFFQDAAAALQRTGATLLAAYEQPLGEQASLSAGLAGGYYELRLKTGTRILNDDDELFYAAMDGAWFPDFNAGIELRWAGLTASFSVPQLLQRRIRFSEPQQATRLQRHYYASLAYAIAVSDKVELEPSAMMRVAEGSATQWDASLRVLFLNSFWLAGTYRHQDAIAATVGVRLNPRAELTYSYDYTTSRLQLVSSGSHEVGLAVRLGKGWGADTDKDGTPDTEDLCPDQPGPRTTQGCPQDQLAAKGGNGFDFDRDGIWDDIDKCPEVAGPYENGGCPWADRDFDGIRDEVDDCPGLAGVESNNGCPIDDRDRDGIVDQFDECPDEPGTFISRGCPDSDYDKDGVVNAVDACPNTYGPKGNAGCPIVNERELNIIQVAMRNLYFNSSQSEIYFKAYPHLDNLAALMKERADWELKIIGHTDDRGAADANLEVSKRRAEAVMFYLINQGVDRNQIIVEYYGEGKPFSPNDTEAGRQLNRRVELEFVFD